MRMEKEYFGILIVIHIILIEHSYILIEDFIITIVF